MKARKSPEFLKKSVVYQLALRSFTPEGTLSSAAEKLPLIAELGVDIVYLLPFVEHDRDMDRANWSKRQIASGFDNPSSPYRLSDYFKVDPEYGCEACLKNFVDAAHRLGMRVMFDLVYFHCGPNATVLKEIYDSVERNPDGTPKNGEWNFPVLNFKSEKLREYLYSNMMYFVEKFGVDGYRCDVGSSVPLDFWEEGCRRIRVVRPDFIMLDEGLTHDFHREAFDISYAFTWAGVKDCVCEGRQGRVQPVSTIRANDEKMVNDMPEGSLFLRYLENHDLANDDYEKRMDNIRPVEAGNAGFVLTFCMPGVPMLYNGNEIADGTRHSIFTKRENGVAEYVIDWSKSGRPDGIKREKLIRGLIKFRRSESAVYEGSLEWLDTSAPDDVAAIVRTAPDGKRIFAVVNLTGHDVEFKFLNASVKPDKTYFKYGFDMSPDGVSCRSGAYGYLVAGEN